MVCCRLMFWKLSRENNRQIIRGNRSLNAFYLVEVDMQNETVFWFGPDTFLGSPLLKSCLVLLQLEIIPGKTFNLWFTEIQPAIFSKTKQLAIRNREL